MEETAFAKINLALHVRGREADGYHRIETLFAFAEHGDRLSVAPADEVTLRIAGPFAPALAGSTTNLVLEAAHALRRRFGLRRGAALTLDKQLPIAAGLGGGSADAAATLRLLVRWWRMEIAEEVLLDLAVGLGSDVPACLLSRAVLGEGRGDRLRPIDGSALAGMPLLLVNPGIPLATEAVFAAWDGKDLGGLASELALDASLAGRNDLEPAARVQVPEIGAVLERLRQAEGVVLVRMSGSGASCFALFRRERDRDVVAAALAVEQPGWWLLASRLRANGAA